MAIQKISCGGFKYDDTTLQMTDGVLSAIGGAGGGITQAQADARYLLKDNGDATGTTTMFSLVVNEEINAGSVVSDSGTFKDATVSNMLTITGTGMIDCVGSLMCTSAVAMMGGLDLGGTEITNVAPPINDSAAANKKYVDDAVAGAASLVGYLKADGTVPMTGDLSMSGHKITGLPEPTNDGDAATCQFVNDLLADENANTINNYLNLSGAVSMRGDLKMGTHKITGLLAPTADTDASTKKYVDDGLATKQDELTGTNGQVVMIDSTGKATAQDYTPPTPSFPYITQSIPASGWVQDGDVYKYTWNNSKILSETIQLVIVTTPSPSLSAWKANKIECISQSAGTLVLSAATAPTASITAIAVLIPVTSST